MSEPEHRSIHDLIQRQLALRALVAEDPRYPLDAYLFVCEAVDYTCEKLDGRRDIRGHELVEGLCDLAADRFGFLAASVLERWGVTRTDDFGDIVFRLVGIGLLGKSPHDSQADFENLFDLRKALEGRCEIDTDI